MAFERHRKPKKEPKTTTVAFALTAEEAEKLYNYCIDNNISVSAFVRDLVIKKLNRI